MIGLATLMGGAAYLNITGTTNLPPGPPRVLNVDNNGSTLILPPIDSYRFPQHLGLIHIIINNGPNSLTVASFEDPTGAIIAPPSGKIVYLFLAVSTCAGTVGQKVYRAVTKTPTPRTVHGPGSWATICNPDTPPPPPPPPPPFNPQQFNTPCVVDLHSTGTSDGTFGSPDPYWFVGGAYATVTATNPAWGNLSGSRWISDAPNTEGGPDADFTLDFTTHISITGNCNISGLVVTGTILIDNWINDILVNGVSTGISFIDTTVPYAGFINAPQSFTLTPANGLVVGDNVITLQLQQKMVGNPQPYGFSLTWSAAGFSDGTSSGFSGDPSLSSAPATKTVTVAGGTGACDIFNGVWTVTKTAGTPAYYRFQIDQWHWVDLRFYPNGGQFGYQWQVLLVDQTNVPGASKCWQRFGANNNANSPPDTTFTCFPAPSDNATCAGSGSVVVSA